MTLGLAAALTIFWAVPPAILFLTQRWPPGGARWRAACPERLPACEAASHARIDLQYSQSNKHDRVA